MHPQRAQEDCCGSSGIEEADGTLMTFQILRPSGEIRFVPAAADVYIYIEYIRNTLPNI